MTKVYLNTILSGVNTGKVDEEVLDFENRSDLPAVGKVDVLYLVKADETNNGLPTIYIWKGLEYSAIAGGTGSDGVQNYKQVTRLGVTASMAAPKKIDLIIEKTGGFLRAPLEILKFKANDQNVVTTQNTFDNLEKIDFELNDYVQFDGKMKLKTEYEIPMHLDEAWTKEGSLYRVNIDIGEFAKIKTLNID